MPHSRERSGYREAIDRIALAALAALAGALVAFKVSIALRVGPGWDTFAFLANAAQFAGRGFGYTELHRPPFLSWLVAIAFRAGAPLDQTVIQWIDGVLSFSGVLVFYLIFRRRFTTVAAASGALLLLAVTPLWAYLGLGYTDTASIALSAWMLLALMKATEDGPRWYLLAGPLFVVAAMTRFTALMIAFPAVVWLLARWRPFRHLRQIVGAAILGIAVYVPAAWMYDRRFGDVLFPFIVALGFAENVAAQAGEKAANAQAAFYVTSLPGLMAPRQVALAVVFLLLIGGIGLVRGLGAYMSGSRPRASRLALAVAFAGAAVAAQLAGGLVLRQVTICVAVLALWRLLGPYEGETGERRIVPSAALDATMLAWLLAYLDFHGHQTIQVPRYFITMAPGLIYMLVLGWKVVAEQLDATALGMRREPGTPGRSLPYALAHAALPVLVGLALIATVTTTSTEPDRYVTAARASAAWLAEHEPHLDDRIVYSDVWPLTAWYLRTNVRAMPSFEETAAFGHELDKAGADYFVTLRARRFAGFSEPYDGDIVSVLQRSSPPPTRKPRVAYLGKSWDNYLESLTGYDFYLLSSAGRYGWEGSAFMDAHTAEELARCDAVAVYGPRWRDRAAAEDAVLGYVRAGGSAVIDASRNLDGLAYRIGDTIMFDTVVRRSRLPASAGLSVAPAFAARHPELSRPVGASRFVDESGRGWVGASYEARPEAADLRTIAWLGDKPAVQVQQLGRGRIYWIGYNLVWHAFYSENAAEARLISAVFQDAVYRSREAASR